MALLNQSQLSQLAQAQQWSAEQVQQAEMALGFFVSDATWLKYISVFLMVLGSALVTIGVAAFVAWNWSDLSATVKFVLLQSLFVHSVLFTWWKGLDQLAGKCSLNAAAFLVGVMWALFGQVYQTGADPYGLFLAWGIFLLPWALVARQASLWLMIILLANLSFIMYWTQVLYPPGGWWALSQLLGPLMWLGTTLMDNRLANCLFLLNGFVLLFWEYLALQIPWMKGRLVPRLVAAIAFVIVLMPTLMLSAGASLDIMWKVPLLSPLLFAVMVVISFYYYRQRQPDLFILTLCIFSCIAVFTTLMVRAIGASADGFLMLAVALILQTGGAAFWLRNIAREFSAQQVKGGA